MLGEQNDGEVMCSMRRREAVLCQFVREYIIWAKGEYRLVVIKEAITRDDLTEQRAERNKLIFGESNGKYDGEVVSLMVRC
jgi:hypothetical protein